MEEPYKNRASSVFIESYGCQMNKYDAELIGGLLEEHHFQLTENIENADVILVNTCSVRKHAEQRALGRIQVLRHWKEQAPYKKLGVIGCMAQRMGSTLFDINPAIDFIIGPDEYNHLPAMINQSNEKICHVQLDHAEMYNGIVPSRKHGVSGWVAVMRGCNNFCSYCIVPYTRGRERSRPADEICYEVEQMIQQGFREVTLLGQNVNSYDDGQIDFAKLLLFISRISGIERIRFMTSHPKDMDDRLLEVIATEKKVCSHIHLPVQSGSNRILKLMNRHYSRENYLMLIKKARDLIPGLAISSDIMVGFPGENQDDFNDTVHLMQEVQFDEAYTYYYSPREGTRAEELKELITKQEKMHRLDQIIELQRSVTRRKKEQFIGKTVDVLPETTSKKSLNEWMGKTDSNHVVIFPKKDSVVGEIVKIRITECLGATLRGQLAVTKTSLQTI